MRTPRTLASLTKPFIAIGTAATGLFAAAVAQAQIPPGGGGPGFTGALQNNLTQTGTGIYGQATPKPLPQLVGGIIQAALGLLGIVLVVIIIYAGFLWMTAQGDDAKVTKAKGMIANAVIGMIIIFAAYAITNFVINALLVGTAQ